VCWCGNHPWRWLNRPPSKGVKEIQTVTNPFAVLKNEDGYLLIMATLMVLVLLTILGIAASRTANTELSVATNELVYQRNFFLAEGAVIEAVEALVRDEDLHDGSPAWLNTIPGALTETNVYTFWNGGGISNSLDPTGNTRFMAGLEANPVHVGSSLDMDKPTAYSLGVYGRCQRDGQATIKVGYIKIY
jgi:hypothetical protein